MIYLNGNYYVEVKDKRYISHPNENNILGLREPPKNLRTKCQVQNQTQSRKNRKVIENQSNDL